MNTENFDVIVVGSGAGGSAAAYRLVKAGLRVALVEKGPRLERTARTLDPVAVVRQGAFKSREVWRDFRGSKIVPEEYFNVGGKTKWYGAALLRYDRHEFEADDAHDCPAWPIGYADLAPYYTEVEHLLNVRNFDCEPDLRTILARLEKQQTGWRASPLPMGLSADILEHSQEATHFDGFASPQGLKADAESAFLERMRGSDHLTMVTGLPVVDLTCDPQSPLKASGVRLGDGRALRASAILLAAGALHSPRLLARFLDRSSEGRALPVRSSVGRNLKLHLLTALVAVSVRPQTDRLRKTMVLLNDFLPHSSVQPLGFDADLIADLVPAFAPRWAARVLGQHAYGFFLQSEDGAHPDNRVYEDVHGRPVLDYDARRCSAALQEHERLVWTFSRHLLRAGYLGFSRRIGVTGTAHASGTLAAGSTPVNSAVGADGRVHGLHNLYVVDGSALTRSSRVNPSLTIYAWAFRVADRLAQFHLGGRGRTHSAVGGRQCDVAQ